MSRYVVRIVGPAGLETYLGMGGTEVPQDEAYPYRTWGLASQAGEMYRHRFANQQFTWDVVNLDDPEDKCSP